ncbi:MAG TPA: hypothetical protein PL018_04900 [Ignavibacteriaceae bacterium]|nr:hypothetical protein [Ignavibacteriaceae bacterium]HRP91677.1 hypothetical protein [Ignavibacteriaceae bacterium]HRQ53572.1 hypothetical protein [Ignavibacteriaceae bacterium]
MRMKILITVKAYPAISKKYNETVCTAGITEEGRWIRIYPIPFRQLDYNNQFRKYEWIELDLEKNPSDFRPESYRPKNLLLNDLTSLGIIEADGNTWAMRRKYVLKNIYTNLDQLIAEAKDRKICTSLAIFKPAKIIDFIYHETDREWKKEKLDYLKNKKLQLNLFENNDENDITEFEVVDKLPYKFSFKFEDEQGKSSTLMIEDWETGMLFWNSLAKHEGNEVKACEDVKKKYFDDFAKTKDYYFFLGTTKRHHLIAPNPFVIIGDFRPKHILQDELF